MITDELFGSRAAQVNRVWTKSGSTLTRHVRRKPAVPYRPRVQLVPVEQEQQHDER